MRERLIDLLEECRSIDDVGSDLIEKQADFLLENGVIVPPCNIGQPVWRLYKWTFKDAEIREGKVSMLQQKADKSWKFRISVNSSVYDISTDEIGKTVFLTKEEAEQALKGGAE